MSASLAEFFVFDKFWVHFSHVFSYGVLQVGEVGWAKFICAIRFVSCCRISVFNVLVLGIKVVDVGCIEPLMFGISMSFVFLYLLFFFLLLFLLGGLICLFLTSFPWLGLFAFYPYLLFLHFLVPFLWQYLPRYVVST